MIEIDQYKNQKLGVRVLRQSSCIHPLKCDRKMFYKTWDQKLLGISFCFFNKFGTKVMIEFLYKVFKGFSEMSRIVPVLSGLLNKIVQKWKIPAVIFYWDFFLCGHIFRKELYLITAKFNWINRIVPLNLQNCVGCVCVHSVCDMKILICDLAMCLNTKAGILLEFSSGGQ